MATQKSALSDEPQAAEPKADAGAPQPGPEAPAAVPSSKSTSMAKPKNPEPNEMPKGATKVVTENGTVLYKTTA